MRRTFPYFSKIAHISLPQSTTTTKFSTYHTLDIVRIVIVEEEVIRATTSWAITTVVHIILPILQIRQ